MMRAVGNRKSRSPKAPKATIRYRRGESKPTLHNVRFPSDEHFEHFLEAVDRAGESQSLFAATSCLERADRILGHSVKSSAEVLSV